MGFVATPKGQSQSAPLYGAAGVSRPKSTTAAARPTAALGRGRHGVEMRRVMVQVLHKAACRLHAARVTRLPL